MASKFAKPGKVAVKLPECPVCLDTMTAPIRQCESGHSLCSACTANLNPAICPTCRKPMTQMRNWQLEEMVNKAIKLCPNADLGCKYSKPSADMTEHLKECIFRDMECLLHSENFCSWRGKLSGMMDHFKECHASYCNAKPDEDIILKNISISRDDRHFFLVQNNNKMLFMITVKIDTTTKAAYWTVQLIGGKRAAQQHIYEVQIISKQNDRRKIVFIEHCYNDTMKIDDIFLKEGKCAIVPFNSLVHFIKDNQLSFRYNIKRLPPTYLKGKQERQPGNENNPPAAKGKGFKRRQFTTGPRQHIQNNNN